MGEGRVEEDRGENLWSPDEGGERLERELWCILGMSYGITFGGTEEPRENRVSAGNLLGFLACMECGLERCNHWALWSGNKRHVGVRWLKGEDLWNLVHRRREYGTDREGCCRCFAPELGMRMFGFGGKEE